METAPDDRTLLTLWLAHSDEAAFQALVGRYTGLVQATCRRIAGEGQVAEDAAQATFLLLWRKAAGLSSEVILAGWLHTVARHAALKAVRGEARRKDRERQAGERWATMNNQPQDQRWAEIAPLLDEGLSRLGAAEREAVVLRFLTGRSWEETATALGVPRNTAEKRVGRALDRLRDLFARRGVAVSASALATILASAPAEAAAVPVSIAQATPEATRLATETAGAITRGSWPWLAAATAAAVIAAGAFLLQTTPAPLPPLPPQAEPPPVQPTVEPPPAPTPLAGTRLVVSQGHSKDWGINIGASADGRFIGTCSMFANELRIWDGAQPDRMLLAVQIDASAIAFAPDGSGFAVLSFRGPEAISLWSWPAGRLIRRLPAEGCHSNEAVIAYLDGGRRLLANHHKGATVYDLETGASTPIQSLDPAEQKRLVEIDAELAKLRAAKSGVAGMISELSGGRRAALDEMRRLHDERRQFDGFGSSGWQIAPALGGTAVAMLRNAHDRARPPALCDTKTGLWLRNCEDRHPVAASQEHQTQGILSASADGAWVAVWRRFQRPDGTNARSVTVWDAATGMEVGHLDRPDLRWNPPLLLPDRSALLVLDSGKVQRWRWPGTGLEDLPGKGLGKIWGLTALDAGARRIAVTGPAGPGRILDPASGLCVPWALGGASEVCDAASVAIGPGGRLVATAATDCRVALWDLHEARLQAHTVFGKPSDGGSEWTHLAFAPDARSLHLLQAASTYNTATAHLGRWMFAGPAPEAWWDGKLARNTPFLSLAVNSRWAAMADGRTLRRFDLLAGAELPRLSVQTPAHHLDADAITLGHAISAGGAILVSPGMSEATWVADLAAGSFVPFAPADALAVADSPDARWRLVARAGTKVAPAGVELQELPSGRVVARLPLAAISLAIDETSQWYLARTTKEILVGALVPVAAGGAPTVRRLPASWCTPTRGWTVSSTRFGSSSYDLRLLPGGRGLLAGRGDGLVLIDVATGTEVALLRAWRDGSWLITTPDGLFTGSPDIGSRLALISPDGQALAADQVTLRNQADEVRRRLAAYVNDPTAAERLLPLPLPQANPAPATGF